MSKKLFILSILILVSSAFYAKQVDVHSAQGIAQKFLTGTTQLRSKSSPPSLNLTYTAKEQSKLKSTTKELSYYYVFNVGNNNGFIIVSADDINTPIIGYSKEGSYDPNNLPDNFNVWMKSIEAGMANAISKSIKPSPTVRSQWNSYSTRAIVPIEPGEPVEPGEGSGNYMIKTKWNQRYPYDQLIPYRANDPYNPGQTMQPATGCVATAAAQIMKYYNYPAQGIGKTEDYFVGQGGSSMPTYREGIDISSYAYDWANMLDEYKKENQVDKDTETQRNAVALLMYHVAAGSQMQYGYASAAHSTNAAKAMVKNFGYDKDMLYIERQHHSDEDWAKLVKKEIDNRRPVYYGGSGSDGHAFVCDGYDENGLFHFNWGWGGYLDGYFTLDAPLEYTRNQDIIANIKPDNGIDEDAERVVIALSTQKNTYMRNETMNIYKVVSTTVDGKEGNYYVALYSMTDEFVSFVTYVSGNSEKYDRIPKDLATGIYKIKVLEKTLKGTYELIKPSPTLEDVVITVTSEVENHSLTLLYISQKGDAIPGGNVTVSLSVYCKKSADLYIDMLLIDKDDKQIQIGNPSYQTLDPSGMPIDLSYSFKIPENIPAGMYKLMPVAKERDTNWESIPSHYSKDPNYVDFEIFANNAGYRIADIGIISSITNETPDIVRKNEFFGIVSYFVNNVADDSRVKNLKVALCDNNDNIKTILESEVTYSITRAYVYARADISVPAGSYKVRLVEQVGVGDYMAAPVANNFRSISLTILDEVIQHEVILIGDLKAENTTITAGSSLPVVVSFKNNSAYKFIGNCGMAIVDVAGNIKNIIYISPYMLNMRGYAYYTNQPAFFSGMRIPSDIAAGNYRLQMVAKENRAGSEWAVAPTFVDWDGTSYRDYLDITVVSARKASVDNNINISVYPNPVQDVLHISSPEAVINKVVLINKSGGIVLTDRVSGTKKSISISHLPNDIYILKVETSEGLTNHKIMKQ